MLKFLLPAQKAQTLTASSIPSPSPLPSPKRDHSASLQVTAHYKINMGNPLSCHWYIWKPIAFHVDRTSFSSVHYKAACRQRSGVFFFVPMQKLSHAGAENWALWPLLWPHCHAFCISLHSLPMPFLPHPNSTWYWNILQSQNLTSEVNLNSVIWHSNPLWCPAPSKSRRQHGRRTTRKPHTQHQDFQ